MKTYLRTLTIAGSDSGGGAGIQADLKTFAALGCFGMSAITAITAQNTRAVTAIHPVPAAMVGAQIRAVLDDIGVDAVKIGMLNTPEVIVEVAQQLTVGGEGGGGGAKNIVLDPVMVAKSGDKLLQDEAIAALRRHLIPISTIITPNIPEAEVLSGLQIGNREQMEAAGHALMELGAQAVLLKGGHLVGGESPDCLVTAGGTTRWLEGKRFATPNTHGTGCTLSSAIAAGLAQGLSFTEAVSKAKEYLYRAISAGADYRLGRGHGPVHHFFAHWS
ncbi:bifunctional hydroxymethylpyrimidine kinase/phosphomethylpyrimidine kinase [Desulfurivibrio alkaliphilus]|uniref:hydroxymethylpyrimidine kinase n=1 Tax=Desulfurivibrio alkaliphilus (strain DSM 19089 / UNIQEM U267 / AHT2) TaxID=589865 RepID=D6Z435_DESAT|nr:bifunctional hydroxymethylpyrimidine kinase/phosphomethylpyrimidine kinase [Desulfurivibrio alkaliphilus]ADH86310.1 phosphomethylpyrimidine kinase [Desulfurivibrio alkaliphilus AHT 2]